MPRLGEVVVLSFFGLFAMGNIDALTDSVMDVGVYGTSTGGAVNLMFFLFVFAVVALILRNYFSS